MKLAIAIPTYNRAKILSENLSTILRYSSAESVSIYVSDNCSSDDTEAVMHGFTSKNANVLYKRNERNIGFDANLASVMLWADGDYVWLMGDDDYVCDGAIARLTQILEREDVDAVVVNGAQRTQGLLPKSQLSTRIYVDLNEVAKDLWLHASWMSSIVIRRDLLRKVDIASLDGSGFIHLLALFHALSKKDAFRLYCSNDVFLTFPAFDDIVNSHATLALFVYLDRWAYGIDRLPAEVGAQAREVCFKQSPIGFGRLVWLKGAGAYGVKDFVKYKGLIRKKGLLLPALVVLATPKWFCRFIAWGATQVRGSWRRLASFPAS